MMVSQKVDVDAFVERMSSGLPLTAASTTYTLSLPHTSTRSKREGEGSRNPFSPRSRPVFASRGAVASEDDGLQVVPSNSIAARIWNLRLEPRPLALPLRVSTSSYEIGESGRSERNPFSRTRREKLDAEGLQVVTDVSPMTPGNAWNLNAYPTPLSLQTPLISWNEGTPVPLNGGGSNNPFSDRPRYSDAEGLQVVASNIRIGEPDETMDAYAVHSPTRNRPCPYPFTPNLNNSQLSVSSSINRPRRESTCPYPLTPDLRYSQPQQQLRESRSMMLSQIVPQPPPKTPQIPLGNDEVQPPMSSETAEMRGNSYPNSPTDEVLIAVFGMTGTGKTTFIEKVSGQKLQVGHNLRSCTTQINKIHCQLGTHNITLIDTPGFDDTSRSDTEVLILIANWLRDSYHEMKFLSGIIYLHRISDTRMTGSSIKNLRMFRKLCGQESMGNVSLVTTMWDKVSAVEGETREGDLVNEEGFWRAMITSGCLVRRHDGSAECARALVGELAGKGRVMLRLQEEIAEGKRLIETEAGVSLNEEILRVKRQHEDELKSVKAEMEAAMKSGNEALQKELEAQHALAVRALEDRASQQAALLNTKAWDLEDQIQASKLHSSTLEKKVETLASDQLRGFHTQEELREQVMRLKQMLALQGRRRIGEGEYYRKWVCTRSTCRRPFFAPRDQRQVWCFFCGKAFRT